MILGPEATPLGMREALRRLRQGDGAISPQIEHASQSAFEAALSRAYENGAGEEDALVFDLSDGAGDSLNDRQRDLLEDGGDAAGDAPVIQLVNQLLRRAVQEGASDLHFEPHEEGLRVRMRIDGFLQEILNRSDVPLRRVVSRLKVMAGLDIAETRLPQDGRIPWPLAGG